MSQTISKAIGEGHGRGEVYAALAYNPNDVFGGMAIKGVYFNPTLVPDSTRTKFIWAYGTRATEKDLSMVASADYNLDPIQINLNVIGTAPTSSTINLSYMNITHDTTAMTALRLKCSDWNIVIGKNVQDVYVYQGELDFTASSAVGGEACVMGMQVNASAGTVTGDICGVRVVMAGASLPATTSKGVDISSRTSATLTHGLYFYIQEETTMTNAIYIENAGTLTNILKFSAASAAVVSKSNSSGAQSYTVRCAVGGVTGYLRLYAD